MAGTSAKKKRQEGKKKKRARTKIKGIEVRRLKPLNPTHTIEGLTGDEEQTGKEEKERKGSTNRH